VDKKILTLTIDEDGDLLMLKSDSADVFLEGAEVVTRRASHVEPASFWLRIAFHVIRTLVRDDSSIAAWTRTWTCLWRVNTAPVGGPILTVWDVTDGRTPSSQIMTWSDRQNAIDAEITFLNDWFLQRGISSASGERRIDTRR
jgi:hypothetical protein